MRFSRRAPWLVAFVLLLAVPAACAGQGSQETPPEGAGAAEGPAVTAGDQESAPSAAETGAQASADEGSMLDKVRSRGQLICGVNDQLPGFGFVSSEGEYQGFDVDFCRAVAAAVLGDPQAVTYRPLTSQERFTALQTGEVDVLIRNTTWTLSRDTQNGLDFGPTTFYDGQGVMVRKDLGVTTMEELSGSSICVQSGTTTEKNIADAMRRVGGDYSPVVFDTTDQTYGAYEEGRCDAATSDKSQLVSRKAVLADPEAHVILDATLSKEPLGPAVLQGDAQWTDIVDWVVYGIITAEELGITSDNVADMAATSEDPEVRRVLGAEAGLGEGLGLDNDFMVSVITAVGNYAEIYERNLGPDTPFDVPRGPNSLWTDGGLLYAPPFR